MFLLLSLLFAVSLPVNGSTITVPIKLDYPLLRQLLIRQLFNSPGESVEILHDPSGCSQFVLSNPRLAEKQPDLEIVAEVKAQIGVAILGSCTNLLQWQGSAGFLGRPVIQPGATSVGIELKDSWLVAADGRKVTSGRMWELVKDHFHPLFSRFSSDLAPSLNALGSLLPDVLPRRSRDQLENIVDSLRLSDARVAPASIDVSLGFEVQELAELPQPEAVLSADELVQWETRWQMMDALFTFAVKYYASETGLDELRTTLLDILLDSRYRLRDALTEPVSRENDPVRRWFLDSWKHLSPIIHKISLEKTGHEPLLWISLLTATDALHALDRLGPAIGLDVSIDGLRRLARMVNENAGTAPLHYDQAVDPELQRLMQLTLPSEPEKSSGLRFDLLPIRSAWAATSTHRLERWVPSKEQLAEYLPLVARLLNETTEDTLKKKTGSSPQ